MPAAGRAHSATLKAIAALAGEESSGGEKFSALDRRGMPARRQLPPISRDLTAPMMRVQQMILQGVMVAATCIATALEKRRPFPVDALVPEPIFASTHAITRLTNRHAELLLPCRVVESTSPELSDTTGGRPNEQSERVEQRDDDGPHACTLSENAGNLNRRVTQPAGIESR